MPPKRKPKEKEEEKPKDETILITTVISPPVITNPTSSQEDIPIKKQKLDDSQSSQSGDDDSLPMCVYGAKCYRKNPDHFKQFKHPKGTSVILSSSPPKHTAPIVNISNNSSSPNIPTPIAISNSNTSTDSVAINSYRGILLCALGKGKISADDKRLLRTYRKTNNISDEDHNSCLKKLGWTTDEYEDGEKKDDDIDLEEERKWLDKGEFHVITLKKEDCKKSKEALHVFSKVANKFYETMSKAQANFSVSEVGIIVTPKIRKSYLDTKLELSEKLNGQIEEIDGFHGTSVESILAIAQNGFLHPDDLAKLKQQQKPKKGKNKVMASKPIELLDDGYFGKGIYFTLFSDYALWYSEERGSNQVMLCKLLPGKRYQCTSRMDGQGLKKGYDSHCSPKGNEIVLFSASQILPRYIITFVTKEANEREQES